MLFASLWMTLRISYRTILSKVRSSVPSLRTLRDSVLPSDEGQEIVPIKKSKQDSEYKKKAEELERKLANIQKAKKPVLIAEEKKPEVPSGKQILANAFSSLTKKVPLETPE